MRCLVLAALCASATAFAAPKCSLVPASVAGGGSLSTALALRGGGALSKETYATTLLIANGMFGLQFLLIPKFFLAQFFDKEFDKHHIFLARFIGVLILGYCALLKTCPAENTFLPSVLTQVAVGIVGPWTAQLTLGPKMPIHLFPVITVTATALLGLAAM